MKRRNAIGLLCAAIFLICALIHAGLQNASAAGEPSATFTINDSQLRSPVVLIAYGDIRFTDPANTSASSPKVRQWLVQRVAEEAPDAVLVNGDIPLSGSAKRDYAIFNTETKVWRNLHLRIFPALGNHELRGDLRQCLDNWWNAFPSLRGRRWYSVQLGSRVYIIVLDSNESLLPGSKQGAWLNRQLQSLAASVDFVFVNLHHPPVADLQRFPAESHNPRPNEIALQRLLSDTSRRIHARFIVTSGHIHNYERHLRDGVVYLVCGGGGATPYRVKRTPGDLYTLHLFPNYHYVKFTLGRDRMHGTMFRVMDPGGDTPQFAAEDHFDIGVKPALFPQ